MENINNARETVNKLWVKYSTKQKIIGIGGVAVLLIAIVVVIMTMTRPTYVPLYSGLDLESMSTVKTALDDMTIDYKIKDQNSIYVKEGDRNRAMIDLAGQNIPKAKFNYSDLIEMNTMFMSDDEKTTAKNYALSNAIASVIESIPAVETAHVNLTIPKSNEFILQENRQPTKASVLITTVEDSELDRKSIDGIESLVANSVEGLRIENVTIHGPSGEILNLEEEENDIEGLTENIQLQKRVEEDLSKSVHRFLTPMLGYENISVMASVRLNFDTNKTQTETFAPPVEGETSGIVRSEQHASELVENNQLGLGQPGVGANDNPMETPDYVTVDENANSTYERNESTINYEMNRIVNEVEKAKGQITDVTVSVILNTDSLEDGELTEDKKKEIADLITSATGIDTRSVQVFAQKFNTIKTEEIIDETGTMKLWMWIAIAVTALIPIIALAIYLIRKRRKEIEEIERQKQLELENAKLIEQEGIEAIELDIKESGYKKSIEDLVDKNPGLVVSLLKTWINEDI